MARITKQVPSLYFGQPGKAFVTLPWPKGGIDKPYERQTFDFLTGSGLHQVSSLTHGSRSYSINWEAFHVDTFTKLEPYRIGANGPGPFVLLDPSAMNLLPANVSAASGIMQIVTDLVFGGAGQGSVITNNAAALVHRPGGINSLRWRFTSAADASATMYVRAQYRGWYGIPTIPGLPYTFSSWVTPDGVIDSNVTLRMGLQFLNASGALIGSEFLGTNTAVTTWTRLSVTATAPAGAVYIRPRWILDGTTMTLNGSVYIDEPMLEQDSVVNDWAPGSGVRPVEIVALGETVPFETRFRTGTAMTLRELAA